MSKIKAVLWDVDGTILDFAAAERNAIRKCFEHFRLGECTDTMLKKYSAINVRWWERLERGENTKPEILVGRFVEFFSNYGIDTAVAPAFNDEYQIRLGDTIGFHPYAMETIEALRGKVIQCAVTNGTKTAQTKKIARSGLDKMLNAIFISEDIGAEKPTKEFFTAVFAAFPEIRPDEMMIVGDSLTSDMRGGNNVGLITCWYNPKHLPVPEDIRIDHDIDDLADVLKIVG